MITLNEQESKELIRCLSEHIIHLTCQPASNANGTVIHHSAFYISQLSTENTIKKIQPFVINLINKKLKETDDETRKEVLTTLLSKLNEEIEKESKETRKKLGQLFGGVNL